MLSPKIVNQFNLSGSVSTDTRKINEGDIFFALKGDNFNGNAYATKALEAGASMVVIDEAEFLTDDDRIVLVEDALLALQKLALHHRNTLDIPVIGITGTNGKTTTKELIHAVLETEKKVHATKGNLNNHIGVPLTLFELTDDFDIAVIEMGANKKGDIRELVEICRPTIGLLTNIGYAHLERFGDIDGVQSTKGELYEFIRENDGWAWVNFADERVVKTAVGIAKTVSFGTEGAQFYIADATYLADKSDLLIAGPGLGNGLRVETSLVGSHNAQNVLAAVVAGVEMGISQPSIQAGIANYQPRMNRTQMVKTDRFTILLDAYNANPSSMQAAIQSVFDLDYGKTALVLGDMFEMGPESANLHADLGKFVSKFPAEVLIAVGKDMEHAVAACPDVPTVWFETTEEAKTGIMDALDGIEFILLKGSRGMALERLMEVIAPEAE